MIIAVKDSSSIVIDLLSLYTVQLRFRRADPGLPYNVHKDSDLGKYVKCLIAFKQTLKCDIHSSFVRGWMSNQQ